MNEAHDIQKYIPNSLAIGDDEGGMALLYIDGKEGFGLYTVGFGNLDIEETIKIAPSLKSAVNRLRRSRGIVVIVKRITVDVLILS